MITRLKRKIKQTVGALTCSLFLATFTSFALWANGPSIKDAIRDVDYIFCIDGGGSKTTLQVVSPKLEVLDIEQEGKSSSALLAGPTNINLVGFDETKKTLQQVLKDLKIGPEKLAFQDIRERSAIVCGLAGLVSNADKDPLIRDIFTSQGFSSSHIALFPDIDLGKQMVGNEGAFLISGTGSICFSRTPKVEKRIGGYGYALGDEGSGFNIGKLALQAAFEEEFEKEEPFILTKKLLELFKVNKISEVIKPFYNGTLKPADVAKIAPLVFEAAFDDDTPDLRCLDIIQQNAWALSHLVERAVKGTSTPNFPVYLQGGVFKSTYAPLFIEMIGNNVKYEPGLQFVNISQDNIALRAIQESRIKEAKNE